MNWCRNFLGSWARFLEGTLSKISLFASSFFFICRCFSSCCCCYGGSRNKNLLFIGKLLRGSCLEMSLEPLKISKIILLTLMKPLSYHISTRINFLINLNRWVTRGSWRDSTKYLCFFRAKNYRKIYKSKSGLLSKKEKGLKSFINLT